MNLPWRFGENRHRVHSHLSRVAHHERAFFSLKIRDMKSHIQKEHFAIRLAVVMIYT